MTTESMIERVARAICYTDGLVCPCKESGGCCQDRIIEARAAIEAMREPTEEMRVAGATGNVEVAHTADHRGRCLAPAIVWRAMIDEALKE